MSDPLAPARVPTPSILDSRRGRLRARAMLGIDWLAVGTFSVAGDPFARVLHGSPRTDVYAAYERIRARGDLTKSRLGLHTAVSWQTCDQILRDPRCGVRPVEGATPPRNRIDLAQGPLSGSFLELDPLLRDRDVGRSVLDGVRTVRQAQQLRRAGSELETLFRRLAVERRSKPRDDVISLLANAEAGEELTPADLVKTCGLLLVAGFETTVYLIGNAVAALHGDPPCSPARGVGLVPPSADMRACRCGCTSS